MTYVQIISFLADYATVATPLTAIGFFFGRLERRIKNVEKKAHVHNELTLIKNTEKN